MKLIALTPERYAAEKWRLRTFIKQAAEYTNGETSVQAVEDKIMRGEAIPVVFIRDKSPAGMMVLTLDYEALHVYTLAGKMGKGWREEVMTALVSIAKCQNRRIIQLKGRKGWTKYLKRLGFERRGEYLAADISGV